MSTDANPAEVDATEASQTPRPAYSLREMVAYMLRLGTLGFGGPVALVGYMHRDLVERHGWISEAEYKEGLTLAQLMPGPLAAQLAIYLGFVHYGLWGATLVGVAFVVPSFLMVLALGWAYVAFGGLPWMQAVFYGVGASAIGIILLSAYKLTQKTIGKDRLLWPIYLVSAGITIVTETESVLLFLAAGVLVWLIRQPPSVLRRPTGETMTGLAAFATGNWSSLMDSSQWPLLVQILAFFTKAGAFVFGSGLAIVPFLYCGVVHEYGWLNERQFLDAVAVAMITPGPVVITVAFIGYLVAGLSGATLAAVGTFIPCWVFTVFPAPYFRKHGKNPGIIAFVEGVTAAAIGAIAGAVIVLGRRTIFKGGQPDLGKSLILAITVALPLKFKKLPEPAIIVGAAVVGLVVYPLIAR